MALSAVNFTAMMVLCSNRFKRQKLNVNITNLNKFPCCFWADESDFL